MTILDTLTLLKNNLTELGLILLVSWNIFEKIYLSKKKLKKESKKLNAELNKLDTSEILDWADVVQKMSDTMKTLYSDNSDLQLSELQKELTLNKYRAYVAEVNELCGGQCIKDLTLKHALNG